MPSLLQVSLLSTFVLSMCLSYLSAQNMVISSANVNFDLQSLGPPQSQKPFGRPFRHPGLLYTTADFDRIKRQKNGSWAVQQAYNAFVQERHSDPNWQMHGPFPVVHHTVVSDVEKAYLAFMNDGLAAKQLALLWEIDGNEKAGRKAVDILDKWGSTLQKVQGTGAQLFASLIGSVMVQAAEIMRHTSSFWESASISRFENMLRTVLLPRIMQSHSNAELTLPFSGNWGTSAEKGMVAMAIFLDDHQLYATAKMAMLYSPCANLTGIISPTGQSSDSGRDQQHTQLGLGNFAESFQMLWNQGEDFYSYADNRLLAGLEYTAKYLGGHEVPFDLQFVTCYCQVTGGPWKAISNTGRHIIRPIFEMAYAHYTVIKNLKMPATEELIKRCTPDGAGPAGVQTDQSSFQTLLFRDPHSVELNAT